MINRENWLLVQGFLEHQERAMLKPVPETPFDTDDVEGDGVTKSFRVRFDRNKYSVPWRLVSQQVLIRADDDFIRLSGLRGDQIQPAGHAAACIHY